MSNLSDKVVGSSGADTSLSNLTATGNDKIASAWVNFNGTGTVAIRDQMNVSSITDNGVGNYTVNFATAMANANYSVSVNSTVSSLSSNSNTHFRTPTTSGVPINTIHNAALTDISWVTCITFGGL